MSHIAALSQARPKLLNLLLRIIQKKIPGQLVIQFTDHCNATCPQCNMNTGERFPRSKLSKDAVKRILDEAVKRDVNVISFTGGEPLLHLEELADLMKYAGDLGIEFIRTGTNGYMFSNPSGPHFQSRIEKIAATLAETPLRNFWISIDSAIPEIHEKMRGFPGIIKGIEKALPIFHEYGIYPAANLGINRNVGGEATSIEAWETDGLPEKGEKFYRVFKAAFRKFYRFVIDLGFTMVNTCYPMSVDEGMDNTQLKPVYSATSDDRVVRFSRTEKSLLFKALFDTLPEFRSQTRIFSPRCSLYALYRECLNGGEGGGSFYPCRGGLDFFFIDAREGNTYPCGYRGRDNFGKYWERGWNHGDRKHACYQCEWECFRDPSALFGPLLHALSQPVDFLRGLKQDSRFYRLWRKDIRYYIAAGFFNGREAPDFRQLRRIQSP